MVDVASWASTERQFLKEEVERLEAGERITDANGRDVTQQRLETLRARHEHADMVVRELFDPQAS